MEILKGGLNVSGSVQSYRLHTKKEESEKNLVPKTDVFKGVLLQQAVQAVVATMLFVHLKRFNHPRVPSSYWKRQLRTTSTGFLHCSCSIVFCGYGGMRYIAIFHAALHAPQ